jgi:hypothetical protein
MNVPTPINAPLPTRPRIPRGLLVVVVAVWAAAIVLGMGLMMAYAWTPGQAARAAVRLPVDPLSSTTRPTGATMPGDAVRPTLTVFLHPQCPCSRSTVDAVASLLAERSGQLDVRIVFADIRDGAEPTTASDLWHRAGKLANVRLELDPGDATAIRFDAQTSGQVFLYDAKGRLAFSGGLTPGRGMAGESAGTRAVTAILDGVTPATRTSPVYGCALR